MPKHFKLLSLALITLLYLLVPSQVSAQMFWSTPAQINNSENQAILPATVTGPNGYLHTVWASMPQGGTPDYSTNVQNPGIYYSYWNGDAWSTPVKVSENIGLAVFPSIAVTPNGTLHIIWEDDSYNANNETGTGRILYRSSTDYGSTWSSINSLSESLDGQVYAWAWYPRMVSDAAGNLHVAYLFYSDELNATNGSYGTTYYTKWTAGTWSSPQPVTVLSENEGLNDVQIAIDSNNYPHLLLEEDQGGPDGTAAGIYYTYFNGTAWVSATKISTSEAATYPRIILDKNNNRHVIWTEPRDEVKLINNEWVPITKNTVQYTSNSGSGWSSLYQVSTQADNTYWGYPIVGLTFDSNNNVYAGWGEKVGWQGDDTKGIQVSYKRRNSSGNWDNNIINMRYVYDLDTPFLYKDKWDNQHFAWVEQDEASGNWNLWYSTVPININTYNPASNFSMTLANTLNDNLSIPSGALSQSATISAQVGPLPASANPGYTTLNRSYTFRPHGTNFSLLGKNATATINYADTDMLGADERNLKVYIWDGTLNGGSGGWSTSFSTSVNRAANRVTITLPHFSVYGIMAPLAEKNVNISWAAPIAKEEVYSMNDGSTLPIKFTLTYDDGTFVPAPQAPEDIILYIRNSNYYLESEPKIYEYKLGTEASDIKYNPYNHEFMVNLHTRELNLQPGNYSIKVLFNGYNWGGKQFQITEPGKAKGKN